MTALSLWPWILGPGICTKCSEHSWPLVGVKQLEARRAGAGSTSKRASQGHQAQIWDSWWVKVPPVAGQVALTWSLVFQRIRRNFNGHHDLASGVTWHHFQNVLLIEAIIICSASRGSDTDATSQWEEYNSICSPALKLPQFPLCRWRIHGSESIVTCPISQS